MKGRVVDANELSVGGTLIEIYDNPELDFEQRKRIGVCVTDESGRFCFRGLAPGKYELRGSCSSGFDAGHTIVTLAPKQRTASTAEILVTLNVSQ
jgi:protocatechuate 3,4-dioxygenase beta subunit